MFQYNNYGMGILLPVPRFIFFCIFSLISTFFTYHWSGLIIIGSIIIIIYLAGRVFYKLGIITSVVAGFLSFVGNIFIHKSGDLIFLSDQDDFWFENKIKFVINEFKSSQYFLYLNNAIISDNSLNNSFCLLFSFRGVSTIKWMIWSPLPCPRNCGMPAPGMR